MDKAKTEDIANRFRDKPGEYADGIAALIIKQAGWDSAIESRLSNEIYFVSRDAALFDEDAESLGLNGEFFSSVRGQCSWTWHRRCAVRVLRRGAE